ncbi:STAS domain-containing protein [Paenibacillaceae bacterium WGS1546]|uniref:STAS domain-containing protein n=1 Tax=Cohnella sp. WGS1546 TaxID=3366810 RepID=UPI00372D60ED
MCFEITETDRRIEVVLTGAIGVKEATSIRQQLFPTIRQDFRGITFRLGAVTEMDSSGLGLLLAVKKLAADFGADVSFKDIPASLRDRLVLAGILA